MKLPVNSVRIHRFRGVPSDLVVDFRAHDGNAASAIVSGDNGTGTSSIVDALEFALQARVNRSQKFHGGSGPSALSLAGIGNPSVEVALSDGTIVSREMTLNLEQKLVAYNLRPHPKFGMAPFVLRRSDILRFWDTPDIERQLVFWDYFRSSDSEDWSSSVTEQVKGLEQERVDAKQRRRDIAKRIAVRMDIDVEEVPIDPGAFQDFVRDRFYGGFNKKQRKQAERRGIKFRIPQRLDELIQEMRKASEVVRSLNGEISRLRLPTTSQPKGERLKQMDAVLTKVSERLTDSFCSISTSTSPQ